MKTAASVLALAVAVRGHYTFSKLQVNGQAVGSDWQYIREHTRGYMPTKGQEILENDFRCQPGGDSGANTEVYTVGTGDEVTFLGAFGMNSIEHPGPAQVYFSKTDDVKSYDGSGDWFKVREALFCSNPGNDGALTDAWCTWGEPGIAFTVPETVPDGEYLVRVEHIPLHGAQGTSTGAEYYYSCGQLKVEGSTAESLPSAEMGKIPGMIQPDDDAVTFNIWTSVSSYPTAPGVALAPGGETWGTADGSSDAVVENTEGVQAGSSSGSSSSGSSDNSSSTPTTSQNTQNPWSNGQSNTQSNGQTSPECEVQYVERSVSNSRRARRSVKA